MKNILSLFIIALLASCAGKDSFKKFDRLSGLWQAHNGENFLYEEWSKPDKDVMFGKSYMINGGDSIVFERMELKKQGDSVYYIPTVKDQNNSRAIPFKLVEQTDSSFVFENKQHDFPQRIIYRFIGKDSIAAKIEGLRNGVNESAEFNYSRVKKP